MSLAMALPPSAAAPLNSHMKNTTTAPTRKVCRAAGMQRNTAGWFSCCGEIGDVMMLMLTLMTKQAACADGEAGSNHDAVIAANWMVGLHLGNFCNLPTLLTPLCNSATL